MTSTVQRYQREMFHNLTFFATWLPGDKIAIGDVGILKNGRFRKLYKLSEFGISVKTKPSGSPQSLYYTSTSGTKVDFSVGTSIKLARSGIQVSFSEAGAFIFDTIGTKRIQTENRSEVEREILKRVRCGEWKKSWMVVEELYRADYATIIVCQGKSASIAINAKTEVANLGSVSLADPSLDLSLSSVKGQLVHILGAPDAKPLYSCSKVREGWFSEPEYIPAHKIEKEVTERVSIEELINY